MPDLGRWEPLAVSAVAALLRPLRAPWWLAGGYAAELAAGRPLRPHRDVDVMALHRDAADVRGVLTGWDLWVADPPGAGRLRPWPPGEPLPAALHDVWCRESPGGPWRLQVMFDGAEGDVWASRRDARVQRPLELVGAVSADGVPYLRPEILLFYKAKSPRPQDDVDRDALLPLLDADARGWLAAAVRTAYGEGNRWVG